MNLNDIVVLFVDCQTTGASTRTGELIEMGWARSDLLDEQDESVEKIDAFIVRPRDTIEISKRIQKVTGISEEDIASGISGRDLWQRFLAKVKEVEALNRVKICPVVIHYAKFEMPFLQQLHRQVAPEQDFPLHVVCTHEISRRLLPALPRRGIRALAGYFGFALTDERRCAGHIRATAVIWKQVIKILEKEHNINTYGQLMQWLKETPLHPHMYHGYPMDLRQVQHLPDKPGIYRMMRSNGDILYIGKATSIKKRVQSYFRKKTRHSEHILEMLSQAKRVDFSETGSALEAALLESDEIKQYTPPYNIALRERERGIWFCTNDFKRWKDSPDRKYCVGPFTRKEPIHQLGVIRDLLLIYEEAEPEELRIGFGMDEEYAPGVECVKKACEMFTKDHADLIFRIPAQHALSQLGKKFWLQQKVVDRLDDDDEEDVKPTRPVWSPSSVTRLIQANVLKGTHAIRMSRWLVWLSESSVAWQEKGMPRGKMRVMVLEEGGIVEGLIIPDRGAVPIPPGHDKSFHMRQNSFNLVTLDRLRVLTTEMRKLTSTGYKVTVRFRPDRVLESDALSRVLAWL